ncbi:MAG: ParA family protein [Coriobacteriia bacterium]|nr:ParA family protein [Coriobacteriia bacterium]MDR2714083.1 ParA family protein [Coriobacteriales bacterium]
METGAKKALIVAIINQKGGVGKSTTAVNLSDALGELKKKVLLVDLDPQGNATSGLGVEKHAGMKCVYDGLINDANVKDLIIKNASKNVDVIPATINLAGAEVELMNEYARERRLAELLVPIENDYDYILVDCPPSLGQLTMNALTAAQRMLIPIQCEFYALEGLTKLLETEKIVKARMNPELESLGVVMTMYDKRTSLANQVVDEVKNFFGDKVFKTVIPRNVKLAEAPSFGQSIIKYDPSGKGATAYRELAKEVISRG